jgi:hypothetical protein
VTVVKKPRKSIPKQLTLSPDLKLMNIQEEEPLPPVDLPKLITQSRNGASHTHHGGPLHHDYCTCTLARNLDQFLLRSRQDQVQQQREKHLLM